MNSDRRASPERLPLYQAGSGHVLSHFASLATPDVSKKSDWQRRSMGVRGSSASASSAGPRSVPRPSQQTVVKVFDDFVVDNQTESSDRSSEMSAETAAEPKSYTLSFSPPRHSLKKSRREPNAAAQTSTAGRSTFGSSMGASYRAEDPAEVVEEETGSPVASSVKFLMSRDPEEEERVLNSKSDRDKVYLYKKVRVGVEWLRWSGVELMAKSFDGGAEVYGYVRARGCTVKACGVAGARTCG